MLTTDKEDLLEDAIEDIAHVSMWSPEEALYLSQSPDQLEERAIECSTCNFYQDGACEIVQGVISPNGFCRFYIANHSDTIENLSQTPPPDEDLLYTLYLLQDTSLPQYKFDALLENLICDLSTETQTLSASSSISLKEHKDTKGQLTQKGREYLTSKPSSTDTPEKIRRNGQFLTRFYGKDTIPALRDDKGRPSRYALAASVFNEPVPKNNADVKRLDSKGKALLKRYEQWKQKGKKQEPQPTPETSPNPDNLPQLETYTLPLLLSNGLLRVPIAKKGRWYHDTFGIVSFSDQDFEQIKELSNQQNLGFSPYITLGHPTNLPYDSIDAELKSGSLVAWDEEDDVLFGLFDAKEDVYSLVKSGDYEYSSGEFIRNYKDKATGEDRGTVMMRVALTNSPFLPFGDAKVEALSTSIKECPPHTIPFVIKLSTVDNNTPLDMTIETQSPTLEAPVTEAPVVEAPITPPISNPLTTSSLVSLADITSLIKSVTDQASQSARETLETSLKAVEAKYEAIIDGLKSQVDSLKTELTSQTEVTQAFSTSLSNQQKQVEYRELLSQGVPAVLVQKYSLIQSALEAKQSVVKLSTQAGEQELPVLAAIKDLLKDAVHAEPVHLQQFGQSANPTQATSNSEAQLRSLIERNRELAKQKSIK